MADKTDCRLTRDLIFDAVPWAMLAHGGRVDDVLGVAYVFFCQHLRGTRDLILGGCHNISQHGGGLKPSVCKRVALGCIHTDNERNHACAIATSGLKTLDELLDLPDLDLQKVVSMGGAV